jgi:hypothetical protein
MTETVEPVKFRVQTHPTELKIQQLHQRFLQQRGPTVGVFDHKTKVISADMATITKVGQQMQGSDRAKDRTATLWECNLVDSFTTLKILGQDHTNHHAAIMAAKTTPDKLTARVSFLVRHGQEVRGTQHRIVSHEVHHLTGGEEHLLTQRTAKWRMFNGSGAGDQIVKHIWGDGQLPFRGSLELTSQTIECPTEGRVRTGCRAVFFEHTAKRPDCREIVLDGVNGSDATRSDQPQRINNEKLTVDFVKSIDLETSSEFQEALLHGVQRLGGGLGPVARLEAESCLSQIPDAEI